jgi:hypothetical protein
MAIITCDWAPGGSVGGCCLDSNIEAQARAAGRNNPNWSTLIQGHVNEWGSFRVAPAQPKVLLDLFEVVSRERVIVDNAEYARVTFVVPDDNAYSIALRRFRPDKGAVIGGFETIVLFKSDPSWYTRKGTGQRINKDKTITTTYD